MQKTPQMTESAAMSLAMLNGEDYQSVAAYVPISARVTKEVSV